MRVEIVEVVVAGFLFMRRRLARVVGQEGAVEPLIECRQLVVLAVEVRAISHS